MAYAMVSSGHLPLMMPMLLVALLAEGLVVRVAWAEGHLKAVCRQNVAALEDRWEGILAQSEVQLWRLGQLLNIALPLNDVSEKDANLKCVVSKCRATPARIAATPPETRQGFGGPNYPHTPYRGWDATGPRAFWGGGGCSCETPATPSKLWKEPRQGCR